MDGPVNPGPQARAQAEESRVRTAAQQPDPGGARREAELPWRAGVLRGPQRIGRCRLNSHEKSREWMQDLGAVRIRGPAPEAGSEQRPRSEAWRGKMRPKE